MPDSAKKIRLRSVFVSDVHLGSRDCRARELLQFLETFEADYLFLVGDIVDFWSLRRSFYWPEEHNEVLRAILAKAKEGTKVIYVPGNHDDNIREFCGSLFGNMSIRRRYVHATADGREFLIMHGDEFDTAVKYSRWLARFGATAYEFMMRLNRSVNACRRAFRHAVLVAGDLSQAAASEGGAVRRRVRTRRGAGRTQPQSRRHRLRPHSPRGHARRSTACSIATMATGWRVARRWWNPAAASCRCGTPRSCTPALRAGGTGRDRCVKRQYSC